MNPELPTNMEKMMASLAEVNAQLSDMREQFNVLDKKAKKLTHAIELVVRKEMKNVTKNKKERKPCGFAVSTKVTPEMSDFMGKPHGELISRIEITKYLNKYIKEQNLEHPDNKQIIVPDEKLWSILGNEALNDRITHFTIQKYLNKHFIK